MASGWLALGAVYWDDAWHTHRGRDSFFVPPHVLLYASVLSLAALVGWWAWTMRDPRDRLISLLGAAGVAATFAAAPIDEAWHQMFGRDAVLWSPPHLAGVAATFAIAVTVALFTARERAPTVGPSTALILGATFVVVMEYEADVPQFSPALYLPVVTAVILFTRPIITTLDHHRNAYTRAAAWYTAMRIAVAVALLAAGFSAPVVPPLLIVAVAVDRLGGRPAGDLTISFVVHAAYIPWLAVMPGGLSFTGREIAASLAISGAVTLMPHATQAGRRGTALAVLVPVLILVIASSARAHDPGQGDSIAEISLRVRTRDGIATVQSSLPRSVCASAEPSRVIARRAGSSVVGPFRSTGGCAAEGSVRLPRDGRWFVYVEYLTATATVEAWLPVDSPSGSASEPRSLYEPPRPRRSPWRAAVGTVLVACSVGLAAVSRRVAIRRGVLAA